MCFSRLFGNQKRSVVVCEERAPRPVSRGGLPGGDPKSVSVTAGPTASWPQSVPMSFASSSQKKEADYGPPPGPPPQKGRQEEAKDDWIRPPAPDAGPRPQHDWQTAVPDTSTLPPPPAIFSGHDASPANNATNEEAHAGEMWCNQYPLSRPMTSAAADGIEDMNSGITLLKPSHFTGSMERLRSGAWLVSAGEDESDTCIISNPPLYVVEKHDPTSFHATKVIYYEVKLLEKSRSNNVALGFAARPYPPFRLPGWHRGSLAVHGDDGHKYINDRWGGKDFTAPFRQGEILGLGMAFMPAKTHKPVVRIFFTRNGEQEGAWDLHEETDAAQDLPVTGLEGFHDLGAAVGVFDGVKVEIRLDQRLWAYEPTW
ncbi:Concanavalin A-like lectin/glucanase [Moelleriella libera RCEF 2490]|uniref:Concanavalin A-like lectin/glucanase n=1 Tax=Moelleriella libera RCEF 2490 TaxID=1081109 RepID=A0A166NFG1_9HYPO|nr:Concanavalin A-like lectin/glucanase [Moelleriella libera RCEF 2490]